ncbi:hypothetical protein EG829_12365 [bacterium]|nr:hypothetical protein [bacterium]
MGGVSIDVGVGDALRTILSTYGPGLGLAILVFLVLAVLLAYVAARNENIAKRTASVVARFLRWIGSRFEYASVKWDIEGRINDYAAKLACQTPGVEPVLISVDFVKDGQVPESFFKNGDLIIRLRDSGHKDENLVRAAETYVSEILLPRSKTHMSIPQQRSLDLWVTDDLLQAENPSAHTLFTTQTLGPALQRSQRIGELLKKYDVIHYVGQFYPVLLQELTFLSDQRVTKADRAAFQGEVNDLVDFFASVAQRAEGSEDTPLEFRGSYSRCRIIIVARHWKAELGDVKPWVRLAYESRGTYDTLYLIASAHHYDFMGRVAGAIEGDGYYKTFGSRQYKARIMREGHWVTRDASVLIMRNIHLLARYIPHAVPHEDVIEAS